jgi:hypothetical protein
MGVEWGGQNTAPNAPNTAFHATSPMSGYQKTASSPLPHDVYKLAVFANLKGQCHEIFDFWFFS